MTYTFLGSHGGALVGLTSEEAAIERLTYDNYKYEIRQEDDDSFTLYHSNASTAAAHYSGFEKTVIFSLKKNREEAENEIFEKILFADGFGGYVMSDEDYAEMISAAAVSMISPCDFS